MSANLMELIIGAVSDKLMGQLGGVLGTGEKETPSLLETAAGTILGGLIKKSSDAQGTQDIFGAVEQQDDSILDKLGDLIGGDGGSDQIEKQGSGILDMVMGGSGQSSEMIDAVTKALGLDKGMVGKLLAIVAPIVLGVIGKHLKSKAMDSVGLGDLLGTQKSHLAGVLPASLTSNLGFDDFLKDASETAENAVSEASSQVSKAASQASSSGGGALKFIVPVALIVGGLLYFGPMIYNMLGQSTPPQADPAKLNTPKFTGVHGLDFESIAGIDKLGETGEKLTTGFTDLARELDGVNDVAAAQSLATKVNAFGGTLDGLGLDKLDGVAKTATSGMVAQFADTIKNLLAGKTEEIQGILKPVFELVMEKLSAFRG